MSTLHNYDSDSLAGDSNHHQSDGKSNEILETGDVIAYFNAIGVWGRDYDLCIACVTRVNPDSEYPLTLDNSDTIPDDSKVKRLQRFDGKPINPGGNRWRPISSFQLMEGGTGGASNGIMAQATQFTTMFNANG